MSGEKRRDDKQLSLYGSGIPGLFGQPEEAEADGREGGEAREGGGRGDFIERLAAEKRLSPEQAEAARGALEREMRAPLGLSKDGRVSARVSAAEIEKAAARVLWCYPEIAASTGMPVAELVQTAADYVRKGGAEHPAAVPAGKKRVFFEISAEELVRRGSVRNYQSRMVTLGDTGDVTQTAAVTGGNDEILGMTAEKIAEVYGYSAKAAVQVRESLDGIRQDYILTEGTDVTAQTEPLLSAEVITALLSQRASAKVIRESVSKVMAKRKGDAGFNLHTGEGVKQYLKSQRGIESGLSEQDIGELFTAMREQRATEVSTSVKSDPNQKVIVPVYRSKPDVVQVKSLEKKDGLYQMRRLEKVGLYRGDHGTAEVSDSGEKSKGYGLTSEVSGTGDRALGDALTTEATESGDRYFGDGLTSGISSTDDQSIEVGGTSSARQALQDAFATRRFRLTELQRNSRTV